MSALEGTEWLSSHTPSGFVYTTSTRPCYPPLLAPNIPRTLWTESDCVLRCMITTLETALIDDILDLCLT